MWVSQGLLALRAIEGLQVNQVIQVSMDQRVKKGLTGVPGFSGSNGIPGHPGQGGPRGKPGADGCNGTNGEPGLDGIPGRNGRPGFSGQPGRKGEKGDTLELHVYMERFRGDFGAPGSNGILGPPGDPGPRGQKGTMVNVLKGVKGDQGDIGPAGPPGNATYPQIRGLLGYRGQKGLKGERGDRADNKGETGVMGFSGARGPPGAEGSPGIKGDLGETGPTGQGGIKGSRGEPGELISSGTSWPWSSVGKLMNRNNRAGFSKEEMKYEIYPFNQLALKVLQESRVLRAKGAQLETKGSQDPQDSQPQLHNIKFGISWGHLVSRVRKERRAQEENQDFLLCLQDLKAAQGAQATRDPQDPKEHGKTGTRVLLVPEEDLAGPALKD
ncbi:hypothetical protein D4764_01G0007940 [Takifugu flavidus]|uniref:Uncharacterized protein n=1 Tax=Takifugu flavidus TaxID=433684 RepID=A0A5C6PPV0_9TELE|nr:hypothetical protein D4764_01G0007940 [Takifugu flavidus]